ncbi:MAG TPA: hypothetical protein VHS36_04305 [Candidatus Limnocylindrales bacterium]|jgi:hypothetical protein|nr:hypothetical protein [Candidatus Limnocylindrales bacterium]
MEPLLILPLLGFFILLVLFSMVLRRAGRFLAQTRDVERFRRQVGDLGHRVELSLGEVSSRVDAVRRGSLSADAIGDDLTASLEAVALYAGEARALRPPIAGKPIQDEIVSELERVARALEMVEHGRSIQTSARSGGRELEAQTSIKRGYLNVLHAREAIARQAQVAAELTVGDPTERFQRRGT